MSIMDGCSDVCSSDLPMIAIGVGSIGLSALLTAIIGWQFYQLPGGASYTQVPWSCMNVDGFAPRFALHFDQLSMLMMCVIQARKSVVAGKRVSVRVYIGGRRIIKTKNKKMKKN